MRQRRGLWGKECCEGIGKDKVVNGTETARYLLAYIG